MKEIVSPHTLSKRRYLYALTGIIPVMVLISVFIFTNVQKAKAASGTLEVTLYTSDDPRNDPGPLNAYNLIVDSNVTATSTQAPNVATVAVRYCNTGTAGVDDDLTNVWAYIGDWEGTVASSLPGDYPDKAPSAFNSLPGGNSFTDGGGSYSFTHLGGTSDAKRFIGTLPAGECSVQYWHFTYPQCENVGGVAAAPPCTNSPTWGDSVNADDDMSLNFDVWASAYDGTSNVSSNATWTMWMRNEISAMANKIKPNPDGVWFNTDTSTVLPGETVTTNGIKYEFGNINQGFDNSIDVDGDGIPDSSGQDGMPDYNAWAQPIGNPSYDPSCFRLVKTETELTISRSGGLGVLTLNYTDQLYYTNLPSNNTGVRGVVKYTFLALNGACFSGLSPYQEVASGSDNEKFNGDYGTGIPPLLSSESKVGIDKSSTPATIPLGDTTTYTIPFWNDGGKDAGLYLSTGNPLNSPLVIKDVVPDGMQYVCKSASATTPAVPDGVTIYYSQDGGVSWSTDEADLTGCDGPTDADPTDDPISSSGSLMIQWWLNGTLPANTTGTGNFATFDATVPSTGYSGPNFIDNCATSHFGPNGPAFDEACAMIMIPGANTLGDFVWRDMNNDGVQDGGTETGINGVLVTLYYDANGDGVLDDDEKTPVTSMLTSDLGISGSGGDYKFTQLPDAKYIVVVDTNSASIPTGYYPSPYSAPKTQYAVNLIAAGDINYVLADFGFAPSVNFDKHLATANPSYEGDIVRYHIDVTNNRSGSGEPPGACVYNVWGQTAATGTSGSAWLNAVPNAQGVPDGNYATAPFAGNSETLVLTDFTGATIVGTIQQVYVAVPISVLPTLAGSLEIEILDVNDNVLGIVQVRDAASLSDGILYVDVTNENVWSAADFVSGAVTTKIQLTSRKTANPSGDLYADAVGYRVTTSETCGNPSDTINSLPLTDTFDNTKLQFEYANPPVTSVSSVLTETVLTWANAGPIYAGQTKNIIVYFTALEPPDIDADAEPDPTTHTNCSATTGGTYTDGALVNDGADCATHDINPGGEIGDLIWYNTNGDAVQDAGEEGIPNVIVYLCTDDPCTNIVKTTSTNSTGYYLFKGVPGNTDYYVHVDTSTLPNNATAAWTNNYDDDCTVPCNTTSDDTSGAINLPLSDGDPNNDDYYDADFGYVTAGPLLIGTVWHDRNNNNAATPDTGTPDYEEGLAGVTVYVVPTTNPGTGCAGGTPPEGTCDVAVTDTNGNFIFTGLSAKTYNVYVLTSTGPLNIGTWNQTYDTNDTGGTISTPSQVDKTLVNGTVVRADYSYRNTDLLNIGDTIFTDWNGDATQDTGEEGISSVTVHLYRDLNGNGQVDANDLLLETQATIANGQYLFTGYPGGTDYLVMVDASTLPAGYTQTLDPTSGAGIVCTTSCDNVGVLPNLSATNLDQDFAYKPTGTGSIGDYVWQDTDGDGIQDSGEPPIQNILVTLYEDSNGDGIIDPATDAVIITTTTDINGAYLFTGLPTDDRDYIVQVDDADSDLTLAFSYPSTPTTVAVNLTNADPEYLDADFGFTGPAKVGDYIWEDLNGDGEQDTWETGINGVTVNLHTFTYTDSNGNGDWDWGEATVLGPVVDTEITAAGTTGDGFYEFTNLPPNDYAVVVDTAAIPPASYANTGDPDAIACNVGCDNATYFNIAPGQTDLSRDFGYQPVGLIGDYLWEDIDGDGVQDPGEPPLAGVIVDLGGTATDSTTTNADGYYYFLDVAPGTYDVTVNESNTPTGYSTALNSGSWTRTYDRDGTLDGVASTIVMEANGSVSSVNGVPCTDCNLEMDFGYRQSTEISGYIFYDGVDDGNFYDGGTADTPYQNITVYLYDSSGNWYATTTTDNNGHYEFFVPENSGDYTIRYDTTSTALQNITPTYERDDVSCGSCDGEITVTVVTTPYTNQDFGFQSTAAMDCGDLVENAAPAGFNTTLGREGACHVLADPITLANNLHLGTGVNFEPNGTPTADATGDTNDEDGITRDTGSSWLPNTVVTLSVDVDLGATATEAYLVGWFDFDDSGQFDSSEEMVIYGIVDATALDIPWALTLPNSYVPDNGSGGNREMYVRFRLYDASSGIPTTLSSTGTVNKGEVEDYLWKFTPTAVSMQDIDAGSGNSLATVLAIIIAMFAGTGLVLFNSNRRRAHVEQ